MEPMMEAVAVVEELLSLVVVMVLKMQKRAAAVALLEELDLTMSVVAAVAVELLKDCSRTEEAVEVERALTKEHWLLKVAAAEEQVVVRLLFSRMEEAEGVSLMLNC